MEQQLREEEGRLIKILESIDGLEENKDWKTLKELVFDKSLESIERQIKVESLSLEINIPKLYKLQGEWAWCKQFCDTKQFVEQLKTNLEGIKKKLR
jgi:hypothetical protein